VKHTIPPKWNNHQINFSKTLKQATNSISITFEDQKNEKMETTVTRHKPGNIACPVLVCADIFARIINYAGASSNNPVHTFKEIESSIAYHQH
jgi:hypothetical protein